MYIIYKKAITPHERFEEVILDSIYYSNLDLDSCKQITKPVPNIKELRIKSYSYLNIICPECVRRFLIKTICQVEKTDLMTKSGGFCEFDSRFEERV